MDNIKNNLLKVTFTYQPLTAGKHKVFLVGDFNDWQQNNIELVNENGIYSITLELRRGKYSYKYVVDGNWLIDENAKYFTGDGYGSQNSVVIVGTEKELHQLHEVTFRFKPKRIVSSVNLIGVFNNWNPDSDTLIPNNEGIYDITILLKPGEYHYKFLINKNEPLADENADKRVDDGMGNTDSIVVVDQRYPDVDLKKGDGKIHTYGLFDHTSHIINPISQNEYQFITKSYRDDVENVFLCINDKELKMQHFATEDNYDYYQLILSNKDTGDNFQFCFRYNDNKNDLYLHKTGFYNHISKQNMFLISKNLLEDFFTPDWVKEGIIYQIFCDRFCNGNDKLNPDFSEWYYKSENFLSEPARESKYNFREDWFEYAENDSEKLTDHYCFFGGDIAGVNSKIDYLKDLGVTIIYFNPLNKAESNHKYDAIDYFEIDPHFGSNEEFKLFVNNCHKNGIRIIVDFAFNHTGVGFAPFQESLKKGEQSKYYSWFEWHKWPIENPLPENFNALDYYQCWWGHSHLPDLDWDKKRPHPIENTIKDISKAEVNQEVVDYILSVAEFWLKDLDIDGFRLDVPNEVPFWFWQLFRAKVKSIKKDAYLVGEIWHDAEEWVNEKYFDAVMNYSYFKDPVLSFFCLNQIDASTFDKAIKPGLIHYPLQSAQVMMNLLDSHDTFRFLESAKGNIEILKLAVLFQMTYIGTPHIWYGDEIGMIGAHDPDNRRPFNWDYTKNQVSVDLRKFYKKLIEIRKTYPCLIKGNYFTAYAKGKVIAYWRKYNNEQILIVINKDTENHTIKLDVEQTCEFKELLINKIFSSDKDKLILTIEQHVGKILLKI